MLYLEYEKAKASFIRAQMMFEDALLEKERLFTITSRKQSLMTRTRCKQALAEMFWTNT